MNEEFLVSAVHQTALITSLPRGDSFNSSSPPPPPPLPPPLHPPPPPPHFPSPPHDVDAQTKARAGPPSPHNPLIPSSSTIIIRSSAVHAPLSGSKEGLAVS
eukprot:TRINITY_DN6621_c0_g1_i1.p3 TRINITY_DN6621_c0_g1~~TRINITY_DN6621_c0_g1_i1.p3  ORF type:complete len:102 (-),score=32.56 TRINITY_DN6621_c0_g1_i1:238-543(-)